MLMKTVVATFDTRPEAERALRRLVDAGISTENVSLLMSEEARIRELGVAGPTPAEGAGVGGVWGGLLGALAGGLVAVGSIAVPGLGLLALGPLVGALAGAGAGGAAGTLIGGLVTLGLSESEATATRDAIANGKILVGANVELSQLTRTSQLLRGEGGTAVHTEEHAAVAR